jgi:hypothetical protein
MDTGFLLQDAAISRNPVCCVFIDSQKDQMSGNAGTDLVILAVWRVNVAFTLKKTGRAEWRKAAGFR